MAMRKQTAFTRLALSVSLVTGILLGLGHASKMNGLVLLIFTIPAIFEFLGDL